MNFWKILYIGIYLKKIIFKFSLDSKTNYIILNIVLAYLQHQNILFPKNTVNEYLLSNSIQNVSLRYFEKCLIANLIKTQSLLRMH